LFPIDIFPQGALSSSVITTVWVGVMIACSLNLRFGMTLSGLVVPGYLVPIIMMKPLSATVIIVEGLIAYFVTRIVSEWVPKKMGMAEMFGRDRFFAIMLVSVLVRTVFDGWWLPELAQYLTSLGYHYDFDASLHSFGLVIVALVANQMWNGGFKTGIFSLFVYLLLTYLAVRWVLIPFTNFSIGNVAVMYEDIAVNILATPKAYFILLLTAFLASRLNLFYGWDFNGIIIPALIALQWYQPYKLVATFVESALILVVARLLLRAQYFSSKNMEGARLIMLFFTLALLYKWALGFGINWFFPNYKASDFFAFGYLLSTLIAVKMYQKEIVIRLTRTTLQTSVMAALLATLLGFVLLQSVKKPAAPNLASANKAYDAKQQIDVLAELRQRRVELYRSDSVVALPVSSAAEVSRFEQGVKSLRTFFNSADIQQLELAKRAFQESQFQLYRVEKKHWILRDQAPARGGGLYVLNEKSNNKLCIEVPVTLGKASLAEAASVLYEVKNYSALAFSGLRPAISSEAQRNVMQRPNTFFNAFHRACANDGVLQLTASELDTEPSQLRIKREAPEALKLTELHSLIENINIEWALEASDNLQYETTYTRFAQMQLNKADIRKLIGRITVGNSVSQSTPGQVNDSYLYAWLMDRKEKIAGKNTNRYRPPSQGQMLFLDEELIRPIIEMSMHDVLASDIPIQQEIGRLRQMASAVNLELLYFSNLSNGNRYVVLTDSASSKDPTHWGTYIWRLGSANNYVVQIPKVLAERQTLEYGAALFDRINARALFIPGARPDTNVDGSSDLTSNLNRNSLYSLVHQRQLLATNAPQQFLQIRGFADKAFAQKADAIISFWRNDHQEQSAFYLDLKDKIGTNSARVLLSEGQHGFEDFAVGESAQTDLMSLESNAHLATIWISIATRDRIGVVTAGSRIVDYYRAAAITTNSGDLGEWLARQKLSTYCPVPKSIHDLLSEFSETRDIILLELLKNSHPNYNFQLFLDEPSDQAYLDIRLKSGAWCGEFNISATSNDSFTNVHSNSLPIELKARKFVESRTALWSEKGVQ
jgi:gamma-polyglutamate biosynthesis protein CapC